MTSTGSIRRKKCVRWTSTVLYGEGVTVLEWADKFPSILPDECLRVSIDYSGHERRTIRVVGIGQRGCAMAEELRESLDGSQ